MSSPTFGKVDRIQTLHRTLMIAARCLHPQTMEQEHWILHACIQRRTERPELGGSMFKTYIAPSARELSGVLVNSSKQSETPNSSSH